MRRVFCLLIAILVLSCNAILQAWAENDEDESPPRRIAPHKEPANDRVNKEEFEKLRDDLQRWLSTQKGKRRHQFQNVLELKVFQTNVFFGSATAIFLVLTALFIGKFLFNVARDALMTIYYKGLSLMGRERATVPEHHFAPLMTQGVVKENKPVPGAQSKKVKLLFCEVLTLFVNPLIKPEYIQKALAEQKEKEPKPKIGFLLMEYQVVSQQEVDKTIKLQQQYRSKG